MGVVLIRGSSWTKVLGDPDAVASAHAALDHALSFKVAGAEFAEAFIDGKWDGRKRLMKKLRGGGLAFPAGLTDRSLAVLRRKHVSALLQDDRPAGSPVTGVATWHGPQLRDYQEGAIGAVLAARGGTLRLPIRAGKTMTAAAITSRLGLRTLFLVPSEMLLHQTRQAFERCLPGLSVTCLGDGDRDTTGDVVVATVQAVAIRAGTRAYAALQRSFGIMFADEAHHQTGQGDAWRDAVIGIEAPWKIGLSATVGLDTDTAGNDLWLEGVTGPIVYSVGISDLIDRGFLVRPVIYFVRYNAPKADGKWSVGRYGDLVVNCADRNDAIAREAIRLAADGHRVLIDVSQVKHGKLLAKLLRTHLPTKQVALLVGQTNDANRKATTAAFRSGQVKIVIATIMGEGVDVPEIDVVINAEGGRGEVSTIQRLRNLTLCPGKTEAIVIEFVDDHHAQLRKWTLARLQIYRSERAFRIRVQPASPVGSRAAQDGGA